MKSRRLWPTLRIALIIVWLFAVLGVFYAVQKPLTPGTAQAFVRSALNMGAALLVVVVAAALGRRILTWLGLHNLDIGDTVWLAPGLGLGALSLVTFFLGLVGGWRRPIAYALMAIGVALLGRDILALAQRLRGWRPKLAIGRWPQRYLGATLVLTLLAALAPPISWDGLFYHLTGPSLYIAQAAITPLGINIPHMAFPSLMEALFGLAMLLLGDVTAKLLHLGYGLLLAALVYRLGRRFQSGAAAQWSLLLLAGTPMVALLAAWAYNDLTLAYYQLATLYALLAWRESESDRWLRVAGLLCGLALGVKYTAFPLPLVGLVYVAWGSRRPLRAGIVFGLSASLAALPWYLRNWAHYGNPVYPFVFSGRNWDPFRATWYAHAGTGIGWKPLQILALPATVTLGVLDVNYYDGRTGPLFLALAPVLVWLLVRMWRRRSVANGVGSKCRTFLLLGTFAACHTAVWALGVIHSRALFQARLLLPALVAVIPLLSEGLVQLSALDRPWFSASTFVQLVVALVLALGLIHQTLGLVRLDPLKYLVGQESRSDYLRRVLGDHYCAMETIGDTVPEDGRVLLLWEPRGYYSPRRAQPDAILDNWAHLVYLHGSEEQIAAQLRIEGFSHVLLNQRGLDFVIREGESPLSAADVERLEHFIDQHLRLSETIGSYRLYAWQH